MTSSARSAAASSAACRFRGHPRFDATVEFCERYDENWFDPAYEWLPVDHFAPAVGEVFGREPSFR